MFNSGLFLKQENDLTTIETSLLLSEADEDLQSVDSSTIDKVVAEFKSKGGTFVRVNADNGAIKAILYPGDVVYPACSAGFCRSQTLWAVLKDYDDKIILFPPHATRYGFDPYNNQINWHRKRNILVKPDEFESWALMPKALRAGFDQFGHLWDEAHVTAEQLKQMREYYDKYYYCTSGDTYQGKRRVYLTFDKNTHAILYRLCQANEKLDEVWVYHFPFLDLVTYPLPEWNTSSHSYKAYDEFSKILLERLDLSNL